MTAKLTELIDKLDYVEIVRAKLGEILLVESAQQQQHARDAGDKDPELWKLRVYVERSNPWEEFRDSKDRSPLVNICWDNSQDDEKSSDTSRRQRVHAVFNIDCYGAGTAKASEEGHDPADEQAAFARDRALRLVRNILMSAHYTYLDLRPDENSVGVTGRWRQSVQAFQLPIDARTTVRIAAARLALRVSFNEFSPQVVGVPLELVSVTAINAATGEVFFKADYPQESDS